VSKFTVGPQATQFGSVTFGNEATVDFHLNHYTSGAQIKDKVNSIRYKDENTNTSGALWVHDFMHLLSFFLKFYV